jgi:hypothetical protein
MTPDRKKPGVAFWATVVVVVVLVLYPLSMGPANWAARRYGSTGWAVKTYRGIYAPILWAYRNGPRPLHDAIKSYCDWWNRP